MVTCLRWVSCAILLLALYSICNVRTAGATTWKITDAGNCNYNDPHGWAITTWSGYPSDAGGDTYSYLWVEGSGGLWSIVQTRQGSGSGSSATVSVDNLESWLYYGYYFQEEGDHSNGYVEAKNYSLQMWCPY